MWLAAIRLSSLTLSETKSQSKMILFLTFGFVYPPPLKSPWSSDAVHFHENFLAVHGSML